MKIVVFGLTISSTWGNGHATLWRGLVRALSQRGHSVRFFEHDVPYYAQQRDLDAPEGCELTLYSEWADVEGAARRAVRDADVGVVTSYCPDGRAAAQVLLDSALAVKVFYDLDTPVTLARLQRGERVEYLPDGGLADFDLVLSFTGGQALLELRRRLGARVVAPLYGSVDPDCHRPVAATTELQCDLSYLGTYADDRQAALERLFLTPARCRPDRRFLLAGAQYPGDFPWTANIFYVQHLPPGDHPSFFSSSALTLNVTRRAMAEMGHCPSGRLFEAAACGTPIVSDWWPGLNEFFEPGRDILVAEDAEDVLAALELRHEERTSIARSARDRTLACHTASVRAAELESMLAEVASSGRLDSAPGLSEPEKHQPVASTFSGR
jgi:spore maturation protein CgeB